MRPLSELLEQMRSDALDNLRGLDTVSSLELSVASYSPLTYQCNVKLRDASLAWGTFVSADPQESLEKALYIALRGEEVRKTESKAAFHPNRENAKCLGELLQGEYGDQIAAIKVEFEPYRGWVVVVFPSPGADLTHLVPSVELRDGFPNRKAQERQEPKASRSRTASAPVAKTTVGPAPAGGRAALTKDALEAEYKKIFGKGPDRNIKKADLAKLLDDLGASSPTTVPEEDDLSEDDDLL